MWEIGKTYVTRNGYSKVKVLAIETSVTDGYGVVGLLIEPEDLEDGTPEQRTIETWRANGLYRNGANTSGTDLTSCLAE